MPDALSDRGNLWRWGDVVSFEVSRSA